MITQSEFVEKVLAFQQASGRHELPWQHPATPYRVLVSEIMLQQTQVTTVIPYFERWMAAFPSLEALAQASEDEVMAHWQGLGYYARARNLQKAARFILQQYQGEFPSALDELQEIPGVGRYTAGAIRSFAYNAWGPIVDGNVRRLFCRLFGIEGVPTAAKVDKQLWALAEQFTPHKNNRAYAQGLLDLGATLCKPQNPDCERCSFQAKCVAFTQNRQHELPTKKPKQKLPEKETHFALHYQNQTVTLMKRPATGIWSSLWMLPELEKPPVKAARKFEFEHTFTHFKMKGTVWFTGLKSETVCEALPTEAVEVSEINRMGIPAPLKRHLFKWLEAIEAKG